MPDDKSRFSASIMSMKNFVPSSGTGRFDVAYHPVKRTLTLTVRVFCNYLQAKNAPGLFGQIALRRLANKYFWSELEKQRFASGFKGIVELRWSRRCRFECTKVGWMDLYAIPVVKVEVVNDQAKAHFLVNVTKALDDNNTANVGLEQVENHDPQAQPECSFHSRMNIQQNDQLNASIVTTDERKRLEAALQASRSGQIGFEENKTLLSPEARVALANFATQLKRYRPQSTPSIPILITGHARAGESHPAVLAQGRADAVRALLRQFHVPNPTVVHAHVPVDGDGERSVKIAIDHTQENGHNTIYFTTAVHEFGHMLGLPDEYLDEAGAENPKATLQAGYVQLARRAKVNLPQFRTNTTSVMSRGSDMMPHHFVTMWDALGELTAPDIKKEEWRITC